MYFPLLTIHIGILTAMQASTSVLIHSDYSIWMGNVVDFE